MKPFILRAPLNPKTPPCHQVPTKTHRRRPPPSPQILVLHQKTLTRTTPSTLPLCPDGCAASIAGKWDTFRMIAISRRSARRAMCAGTRDI